MVKQQNFKRAYITAASENYLPGLKAFFNSLKKHDPGSDVILLSCKLPQEFLNSLSKIPNKVILIETPGKNPVEETAIERFKIASEKGKEYEAVCLMEADIFLVHQVELFWQLARKGFIVVGSNGMIVNFNKEYQNRFNIHLNQDNYIYPKVHTTIPIFLPREDLDWFEKFYYTRKKNPGFDDVFGLNLLGISMGKSERIVAMPPYTFTGIHHFGVKPETGWIKKDGLILSGTEEQVYMIHGKWWNEGWFKDLYLTMDQYFKREGMVGKACQRSKNSIELGRRIFLEYSKDL